jgi:hypothetical protein
MLDRALVKGNRNTNTRAFNGMTVQVTAAAGARANTTNTGTFDVEDFDNFLVAGCAKADHIFGHPKALEAIKKGFLGLGAVGGTQPIIQVVTQNNGGQVVAGMVLADQIDTSIGRLTLVPDFRFPASAISGSGAFRSNVYPLKVFHFSKSGFIQ